jgi:hypothetical protein
MAEVEHDQVLRRILIVVGLVLLVPAAIIALLPVSASALGFSFECNPHAIATANNSQTGGGGSSYVPAILVWLHPNVVVPAGVSASNGQAASNLCGSAALSQMIPALVLGGLSVFLLLFGGVLIRYIRTGDSRATPPPDYVLDASSQPGWYSNPADEAGVLRWWNGQQWTDNTSRRG